MSIADPEKLAAMGRCPAKKTFKGSKFGLQQCRRQCEPNGGTCLGVASLDLIRYECHCKNQADKPREAIAIPEGVAATSDEVEVDDEVN